jgi:hypothetical protein
VHDAVTCGAFWAARDYSPINPSIHPIEFSLARKAAKTPFHWLAISESLSSSNKKD